MWAGKLPSTQATIGTLSELTGMPAFTTSVTNLCADSGFVYCAWNSGTRWYLLKWNMFTRQLVWMVSVLGSLTLARSKQFVDAAGNIYIAGALVGLASYNVLKFDSTGALVWGRKVSCLATTPQSYSVSSGGNVYIEGGDADASNLYANFIMYNSAGVLQWNQHCTNPAVNYTGYCFLDASENFYYGVIGSWFVKLNSAGVIQQQFNNPPGSDFVVDWFNGNYVVLTSSGSNPALASFNPSTGVLNWGLQLTASLGAQLSLNNVAVNGNYFLSGNMGSGLIASNVVYKISNSGSFLVGAQWKNQNTDTAIQSTLFDRFLYTASSSGAVSGGIIMDQELPLIASNTSVTVNGHTYTQSNSSPGVLAYSPANLASASYTLGAGLCTEAGITLSTLSWQVESPTVATAYL